MKMLFSVVLVSLATVAATSEGARKKIDAVPVKRFTIDLNLPPRDRWIEVTREHKQGIENLLSLMKSLVNQDVKDAIFAISRDMNKSVPYPYNEEIIGIAERLPKSTLEDVLLGNIYYELVAYKERNQTDQGDTGISCTSIVAESLNKTIYHVRNLDYPFVKILRNITIMVDFRKNGKIIYTGTTFAGLVGLFTGQRPHKYTISLDERRQGSFWMNIVDGLSNGLNSVVQFHIRDALSQNHFSFQDAVVFMGDRPLIAPSYVIIGGARSGEGVVITRDRTALVDMWKIDVSKDSWYVLETNYDRWTTPPPTDDRRDVAIKAMNDMTRANVTIQRLYNILSTPPVFNNKTAYTTVMSAGHPNIYNTWIRFYRP